MAALGCLIFIVSSFGVLGALRENICFLRAYKMFLLATLVFEFSAGLVGFAFWPEVKKIVQVRFPIVCSHLQPPLPQLQLGDPPASTIFPHLHELEYMPTSQ